MELDFTLEDDGPLVPTETLAADRAPVIFAFDRSMRRFDADGHMHVDTANISKANVCPYYGREIPNGDELGLDPNKIYMLYRDAAELTAAAGTYENKPLMMQHIAVSADEPQKYYVVGTVSNVRFEYPYLKAALAVWDAEAIKAIENGSQEQLSCGYRYTADMSPGEVDGVKYDGVMRGLACNHVALVESGRAGPDVLVSDELSFELSQDYATMKKSALLAALAPFLAKDANTVALDAAIVGLAKDAKAKDEFPPKKEDDKAEDAKEDDKAEDAKEDDKAEDAKEDDKAEDEKEDDKAEDDMGSMEADDELPDAPKGGASKPGGKNPTMDESIKIAVDAALAKQAALTTARAEVEALLGVTAFDSAPATYGAALKKLGIAVDGVPAAAFGAMYRLATKATAPAKKLATDSATVSMAEAIPHINRLRK
jgi:hypothetical protein